MLSILVHDFRIALRGLLARPGFTAIVTLTLAVGIGASTAIFTVVDGVLLQPLPYERPEHLVSIWGRFDPASGFDYEIFPLSQPEVLDYARDAEAVAGVAAFQRASRTLTGGTGEPERVGAALIAPELLSVLGVGPELGRGFTPEEGAPGGEPVAMLSFGLWQERFAGDRAILGRDISIEGTPRRVVGVMPRGFDFPDPGVRLWLPSLIDPAAPTGRGVHSLRAVARLAEGVDLETARAEMELLMAGWAEEFPDVHTGHYLFLRPLTEDRVGNARPALLTLLVASGLVLLLACVNVASVMAARGQDRVREVALRSVLGAGRGRLVSLLMADSLLLAGVGGAAGLLLARLGLTRLLDLEAGGVPRAHEVALDLRAVGFAVLAAAATALIFGLLPALRLARTTPQRTLRADSRTATRAGRGRTLLVTLEVALCFMLVLGAGLMLRTVGELLEVDAGFRTAQRLVGRITLPAVGYSDQELVPTFETLRERLAAVPGVRRVATTGGLPLLDDYGVWDFRLEDAPEPREGAPQWNAAFDLATPGAFQTLGLEIRRGRGIEATDGGEGESVVVVNEAFVRRFLHDGEAIGRQVTISGGSWRPMRIVGVVQDARYVSLDTPAAPRYYGSALQWANPEGQMPRTRWVVLETDTDPAAMMPLVRAAVAEVDPGLPLYRLQPFESAIEASTARPRFTSMLLSVFAVVALVLGGTGTYGVLAYSVSGRARELGIRKALGARPASVVRLVLREGMLPVGAGLGAGAVGAILATRMLASQLFGVSPTDPTTWAVVTGLLLTVAMVACLVPACRALRLEPTRALRGE